MKPGTEKYHYCFKCRSAEDTFRTYIRTKYLESKILNRKSKEKRGFKAFGWYCKKCDFFDSDDAIHKRFIENYKNEHGIKTDKEAYDHMEITLKHSGWIV